VRIVRHEADPGNFIVMLECYDMGDVFYERRLILGSRATVSPAWTTASEADREYGYLASRDTRRFSDGQLGKKL
jgi:hypothetical protein